MRKVLLRPEVGKQIGLGHFSRCLAIGEYLYPKFEIFIALPNEYYNLKKIIPSFCKSVFVSEERNREEAKHLYKLVGQDGIIVLDGYGFTSEYQSFIKDFSLKLVCIDDLINTHFYSDIVVNQQDGLSPDLYSKENYTKVFTGLDYVLLREPFRKTYKKESEKSEKVLLINMGGEDINNITLKVINASIHLGYFHTIHAVLGTLNPHYSTLVEESRRNNLIQVHHGLLPNEFALLMSESQVAVLPASTVSLEACSVGVGLISGYTAENQLGNLKMLEKTGAALSVGNLVEAREFELLNVLDRLVCNPSIIKEQMKVQQTIIDGRAVERYINIFKNL